MANAAGVSETEVSVRSRVSALAALALPVIDAGILAALDRYAASVMRAKGRSCRVDRENALCRLPLPPKTAVRRRLGRRGEVAGLLEARQFWLARLRGFKRNGRRAKTA